MSNKKKKAYFDAREFVNRQIELRTNAALKQKNAQFAADHAQDSKEQLLDYLRSCAEEFGRTPGMKEIIGGAYIAHRFGGDYGEAVLAAELPVPFGVASGNARKIYRDELKVQARLYKQEKAEQKVQRRADQEERSRIAKEEQDARLERDRIWGEKHRDDTDEQLIEYVKRCTEELGHTPYTRDVVGGEYIRRRFNGWSVMLTVAGIPLPPDMKAPPQKQMMEYLHRRNVLM